MTLEIPVRKTGQGGRERILPVLVQIATQLAEINARLARLEARPAQLRIREWKPNHRRLLDGGTTVRRQRRNVAKITATIARVK